MGNFAIDPQRGTITLASPVEYPIQAVYVLRVAVTDTTLPCLTGVVDFTVSLVNLNLNRHIPVLTNPGTVGVAENQPLGSLIVQVMAIDLDKPSVPLVGLGTRVLEGSGVRGCQRALGYEGIGDGVRGDW